MATRAAQPADTVSRNRFMLTVLGGIGTAIGVFYVASILRYLYPSGANTPHLTVSLNDQGVVDPTSGTLLPFKNGVAGPFEYPMVADKSVVVGVFVEKISAGGPLATDNLRVVEQTCTHLGCPVSWVATDNRFECPCHGSQFNRDLSVYHGPAADPLHTHAFDLSGSNLTIMGRN
jgi:Rieske Fe-S protein